MMISQFLDTPAANGKSASAPTISSVRRFSFSSKKGLTDARESKSSPKKEKKEKKEKTPRKRDTKRGSELSASATMAIDGVESPSGRRSRSSSAVVAKKKTSGEK